ncbi:MAG: DUF4349 domain-containing protein [Deltaproteobacteria bacterium]|nr:DUF4349 domain-containing protein [Deltaproteobacteria bacterium]
MKRVIPSSFLAVPSFTAVALAFTVLTMTACPDNEGRQTDLGGSNAIPDLDKLPTGPLNGKPAAGVPVKRGAMDISVKDEDRTETRLNDLMKTYGAYVESRRSSAAAPGVHLPQGVVREITLTLKVEASKFGQFMDKVKALGNLLHFEAQTEDVTLAFMDIKARMNHQRNMEQRLLGYLKEPGRTGMPAAEVEKELAAVREKLSRLNARLRFMENQIAYSTLVLRILVAPNGMPTGAASTLQQLRIAIPWLAAEAVLMVLIFFGITRLRRPRSS